MNYTYYGNELYHHGVKGQKWGERQYQYEDGSLTPEGRVHYGYGQGIARSKADRAKNEYETSKKLAKRAIDFDKRRLEDQGKGIFNYREKRLERTKKRMDKYVGAMKKKAENREWQANNYDKYKKEKVKKAAIIGASVAATALAAYGTYKLVDFYKKEAKKDAVKQGKDMVDKFLKDKSYNLNTIKKDLNGGDNPLLSAKTNLSFNTWKNATYQYNSDGIKYVGDSASKVYKDTVNSAYKNNLKHPVELIKRSIKSKK